MRAALRSATLFTPYIGHLAAYAAANTLTRLIPDLYAGMDVVSREQVGFIPGVARAPGVERAALNQDVVYHIVPPQTARDIVPAMTIPEPRDQTIGNGTMKITKSRAVEFGWTGEEQRGLNHGAGYLSIQANQFAQGVRTLCNEIEADLALEASLAASRATGTSGTTPFASGVGDSAQLRKILDDNGAPLSGRSMVINTASGANLRTNTQLSKANEAGTIMTLRDGELLNMHGFSIRESVGAAYHTKGTGASATTNNAGYAVGATVITLASAGTGTIVAGDVITFAGDANKYVVAAGDADVSNGGTITINKPGLRVAIPAANTNITVLNSFAANVGFTEDALHLALRLPALPQQGDAALDRATITDPRSGASFEVALYAGYRKIMAEVGAAWGVKGNKPEHIALLLG